MHLDVSRVLRRAICSPPACMGYRLAARVAAVERGARILCYHSINGRLTNRYSLPPDEFARQMEWLARHYQPIAMGRLVGLLRADRPLPERSVAVTIDDGYLDAYTHAYPILRRLGIPATLFVPVGLVGRRPAGPPGDAVPQASFVDWRQMREMAAGGMSFGSHGVTHRSLAALSAEAVRRELVTSRQRLSDELDAPVAGFAYPYGSFRDISPAIERQVADAGYDWAVTAIGGANGPGCGAYALRRVLLQRGDRVRDLDRFLNGALDGWVLIQRLSAAVPGRGRE